MGVVADEGSAQPAEDDVDGDTDGEQETRGDDIHPRQGVHGCRTSHWNKGGSADQTYAEGQGSRAYIVMIRIRPRYRGRHRK